MAYAIAMLPGRALSLDTALAAGHSHAYVYMLDLFILSWAIRSHSTTKSPKELARCCDTTHKESQPIHGNGCRPSGFPPQIFCTMQYTTILNLGVSPPGRLEILTASNGFSSRSSYGFIYARWLAALAGAGYFFEASPQACRCSHL